MQIGVGVGQPTHPPAGVTHVSTVPGPRSLVPAKNSTEFTTPSGSLATAEMGMFTGAKNTAPLAGPMILTTGGILVGELCSTVMLTDAEVVVAPPLSVATAVNG